MRIAALTFVVLLILSSPIGSAFADFFPPPFANSAISSDGSKVVRITAGKRSEEGKRLSEDQVSVLSYDAEKNVYSKVNEFKLGELPAGERIFVSNDGKFIAVVNIGHWVAADIVGVRLYNNEGKLLKQWKLADFLSEEEQKSFVMTGSTSQWFDHGRFVEGAFVLHGPAQFFRTWGSSYTVVRGGDPDVIYSFRIDLKTLKLTPE